MKKVYVIISFALAVILSIGCVAIAAQECVQNVCPAHEMHTACKIKCQDLAGISKMSIEEALVVLNEKLNSGEITKEEYDAVIMRLANCKTNSLCEPKMRMNECSPHHGRHMSKTGKTGCHGRSFCKN